MNLWEHYSRPATLAEAMKIFASAPRPLLPIAGGTDLLLDLEQGRHAPARTLVDVTAVAELLAIEIRGNRLFIGAAASLTHLVDNPLVREHAPALVDACGLIGGPQVRNVATLGGNVAHALPAADGTIALLALDAHAEVAAPSGIREIELQSLFLGPGKSSLSPGEDLLVGFHLPMRAVGQSSAFRRIMRPQGVALPILNVAVWLSRIKDVVAAIRVAVGPGGPTPWRAQMVEQALTGRRFNIEARAAAEEALRESVDFRTSRRRASSDYRRHLISGLVSETLELAWRRAA